MGRFTPFVYSVKPLTVYSAGKLQIKGYGLKDLGVRIPVPVNRDPVPVVRDGTANSAIVGIDRDPARMGDGPFKSVRRYVGFVGD